MTAKVAPHDPETEAAAIGAMLLSGSAVEAAVTALQPEDFYDPLWGNVFVAVMGLYRVGEEVNPVTAAAEYERLGFPDRGVALARMMSAQANCPATSTIGRYCRTIANAAGCRRVQQFAGMLSETVAEKSMSAEELIDFARLEIEGLDLSLMVGVPDGLSTLGALLEDAAENPTPWVVPGVIKADWRIMLVGGEGCGKTVLLRQLAIGAAVGIHPFNYEPINPVRTLIVDGENPKESVAHVCTPMYKYALERGIWQEDNCHIYHRPQGMNLLERRDRADLEAAIRLTKPDLVCLGPIYKCYTPKGRGDEESATAAVQDILDNLRVRHRFGLIMEHHAPKGESSTSREMRPHGSVLWQRWPEMGIGMVPVRDDPDRYLLWRSRGDRLPNNWPDKIVRSGGTWPWEGNWSGGMQRFTGGTVTPASQGLPDQNQDRYDGTDDF